MTRYFPKENDLVKHKRRVGRHGVPRCEMDSQGSSRSLITTPYGCATSHPPKLKRVSWKERFVKLEILKYQTRCGTEMYDGVQSPPRTGRAGATRVFLASSKRASQCRSVDGIAHIPLFDRVAPRTCGTTQPEDRLFSEGMTGGFPKKVVKVQRKHRRIAK